MLSKPLFASLRIVYYYDINRRCGLYAFWENSKCCYCYLENFVTENKPTCISFWKKQQNQACLVYTRFIQIINITIQHTCISLAIVNTLDTLCQVNNQHSVASYFWGTISHWKGNYSYKEKFITGIISYSDRTRWYCPVNI